MNGPVSTWGWTWGGILIVGFLLTLVIFLSTLRARQLFKSFISNIKITLGSAEKPYTGFIKERYT